MAPLHGARTAKRQRLLDVVFLSTRWKRLVNLAGRIAAFAVTAWSETLSKGPLRQTTGDCLLGSTGVFGGCSCRPGKHPAAFRFSATV